MFYLDTSIIVPYYCPEPLSEKAEAFITNHNQPYISSLTEVELCSAISRKVHEGGLNQSDGNRIIDTFLTHINEHFYMKIFIEPQHYKLARNWIGQFKTTLRSLDAIHLAIASFEGLTIATADRSLSKSAEIFTVDFFLL